MKPLKFELQNPVTQSASCGNIGLLHCNRIILASARVVNESICKKSLVLAFCTILIQNDQGKGTFKKTKIDFVKSLFITSNSGYYDLKLYPVVWVNSSENLLNVILSIQ
ncbi:hypothetical protein DKX38_029881 [Salix brachista]|uniref:Uncharacterized protein n=1 Tax=Salix brachista TaxID=2182728 RepID=A0A5N5J5W6_9ROSI|nr:hypothetical protein DKX38_029881 [Salix brachista]